MSGITERTLRIAVEGNIAAGKSTFVGLLSRIKRHFYCVQEPVSKWQDIENSDDDEAPPCSQESLVGGTNVLQQFYADPKRWAYTFQSYAFISRMRAQLRPAEHFAPRSDARSDGGSSPPPPELLVFERSVLSDKRCFAHNCYESGLMDETEWRIYKDWHSFLLSSFGGLRLDGLIYLRTSPQTCLERARRRAREEETSLDIEYLEARAPQSHRLAGGARRIALAPTVHRPPQALHRKHERWLVPSAAEEEQLDFETVSDCARAPRARAAPSHCACPVVAGERRRPPRPRAERGPRLRVGRGALRRDDRRRRRLRAQAAGGRGRLVGSRRRAEAAKEGGVSRET